MKRHSIHSGSCSCTSCVYRSRSKRASVQKLLRDGSKVDKLYYGKYLPLRERKLLEKLIRTRGVYDDVRTQLLSTSGSSEQTRSEHKIRRRDDDASEKSSTVLKIVDLVDRGEIGSSNTSKTSKLSSCCSCCECKSLRKIKKYMEKHPPRKLIHHIPYEEIAKYCEEAQKRSKRRSNRLSTKISSKVRAVRFKVGSSLSLPCDCTLSLSSTRRSSRSFFSKDVARDDRVVTVEKRALKRRICDCSCKIAKLPMKSIKKIKNIRRSTTKNSGTVIGNEKGFRIKKDSIMMFREKLHKKRVLKDWECEPVCIEEECIPENCLKKIIARKSREAKHKKMHHRSSETGEYHSLMTTSTRPKKIKKTDSRMQTSQDADLGPVVCECKPKSKSASSMTSLEKTKSSKSMSELHSFTTEMRETRHHHTHKKTYKTSQQRSKKTASKSKLGSIICECKPIIKNASSITSSPNTKIKRKRPKSSKQKSIKHISGEVVKPSVKSKLRNIICDCKPPKESTPSTISFYEAELVTKQTKPGKPHPAEVVKPTVKSKLRDIICECKSEAEPKVRTGKQESKQYKHRKEHYTHYETRANNESGESGKQAVKISSSFKFEIEFSKIRHPGLTNSQLVEHVKMNRERRKKPLYSKRKQNIKYKRKKRHASGISSQERGSEINSSMESQYLKNTGSQASGYKGEIVIPRQCESSICIPYECSNKKCDYYPFKSSKARSRSVFSSAGRLRRKSVGSTTSTRRTSKSRYIQSESYVPNRRKAPARPSEEKEMRVISSQPNKQAVKISSNFSFNIEFYKETTPHPQTDQAYVKKEHRRKREDRSQVSIKTVVNHTSSQSRSSQSQKKSQTGHRLKRCFCTLKMLQKKNYGVSYAISRKTMASFKQKEIIKVEKIKKIQTKPSKQPRILHECKCVSTTGKYKPCECAETNTVSTNKKSTPTLTSQELYERTNKRKRQHTPKTETVILSDTSQKQAVRVGSSFSFDVEFSKTNISPFQKEPSTQIRKENKQIKYRGIKVHKPCVCHVVTETPKPMQRKKSSITPFLHKCLCTVFNKNTKKSEVASSSRNNDDLIYMQNKTIATKKGDYKRYIESCECKPYEYKAMRRVKPQYNPESTSRTTRSTLSGTPKTMTPSWSRNTSRYSRGSRERTRNGMGSSRHMENYDFTPAPSDRQAVRIGSNFSFKIEFFKETPLINDNNDDTEGSRRKREKPKREYERNPPKLKTKGSQPSSHYLRQTSFDAESRSRDDSIYVGSPIDKCVCSLKFQKKGKNERLREQNMGTSKSTNVSHPSAIPLLCECKSTKTSSKLAKPHICECKSTSTKKNKPAYNHPEFCTPETCDKACGRCQDFKQQDMRQHGLQMSMHGNKSKLAEQVSKQDRRDEKGSSLSPQRVIQIGSNFSFNVEFFKETIEPSLEDPPGRVNNRNSNNTTIKKVKSRGVSNRDILKSRFSQASDVINKEKKESNVGIILKRCLCTLGLQKKNNIAGNQQIITQFAQCVHNNQFRNQNKLEIKKGPSKSRSSALKKTLLKKKYLELLQATSSISTEIRSSEKTSRSSTITARYRSRIDFNSHKDNYSITGSSNNTSYSKYSQYHLGYSPNEKQKNNPFYQSFYALNLQVSQRKNVHRLKDNECETGICLPYECDPVRCLDIINRRRKHSKLAATDRPKTKSVPSVKKSADLQQIQIKKKPSHKNKISKHSQGLRHTNSTVSHNGKLKVKSKSDNQIKRERESKEASKSVKEQKCNKTLPKADKDANKNIEKNNGHVVLKDKKIITKNFKDHAIGTDYPKHKSASSIVKKRKNLETKMVLSGQNRLLPPQPKKRLTFSINNVQAIYKRTAPEKPILKQPKRHTVTFGSNVSFNVEFFKDHGHSDSSNLPTSNTSDTKDSPLPKGSGDTKKKTKKTEGKKKDAGNFANVLNRCFCASKLAKSSPKSHNKVKKHEGEKSNSKGVSVGTDSDKKLDPDECEPGSCVPSKCDPRKCEILIKKRHLRSKSTKVKQEKQPKVVKSAVMDKGTGTKGKRISKSFECEPYVCKPDFCDPHACLKRMKAQGIVVPEIDKKADLKTKAVNTEKETKTLLKKCFCVLSLIKSKKAKPKPDPLPKVPSDPKAQLEPKSKNKGKPEAQPKADTKSKPKAKPETKPEPKLAEPKVKPELKTKVKPETKPKVKPEPKPKGKAEPKPKGKPELKTKGKPEPKTKGKPEPKTKGKPEPKPKGKPEPKPKGKPEPKLKSKPGKAKVDAKKKTSLNKFLVKCLCHFKTKAAKAKHGRKTLTPKPSKHAMVKENKPALKLEKKKRDKSKASIKSEKEMETLMPYSKKKFKKNESQVKIVEAVTDTFSQYPCTCPKEKRKKKKDKAKKGQLETSTPSCTCSDQSNQCPVCYGSVNKGEMQSSDSCTCYNACPVCDAKNSKGKKKDKKKKKTEKSAINECPNYECRENVSSKTDGKTNKSNKKALKNYNISDLCPRCKARENAKFNSEKTKEGKQIQTLNNKNTPLLQHTLELCPRCQARGSAKSKTKKNKKKQVTYDLSDLCTHCQTHMNEPLHSEKPIVDVVENKTKPKKSKHKPEGKQNKDTSGLCQHCLIRELAPLNIDKKGKGEMKSKPKKKNKHDDPSHLCPSCQARDMARLNAEINETCEPPCEEELDECICCKRKCFPKQQQITKEQPKVKKQSKSNKHLIPKDQPTPKEHHDPGHEADHGPDVDHEPDVDQGPYDRPLFEMLVNKSDMNVINRNEVLKKLGSNGKESKLMKEAKMAVKQGRVGHPHMEVLIDNDSASIINSEEFVSKMVAADRKYKKKAKSARAIGKNGTLKTPIKHTKSERHDPNCRLCCECRQKGRVPIVMRPDDATGDGHKKGKKAAAEAKKKAEAAKLAEDQKPRTLKPCVCGSVVCKKKWEKLKRDLDYKDDLKVKPCVCGTEICLQESRKLSHMLETNKDKIRKAKDKKRKRIANEKKYQKERKIRKKLYAAEDAKRWKRRKKRDKQEMKYVKKYNDIPDYLAVSESLTDLGKFSAKALCDFVRGSFRVIRHPRDGVENVKDAVKDPKHAAKEMIDICEQTGFFATMARIRRRFVRMKATKDLVTRMESHPVSNFILHLPDKNPKHRMKKFKPKRVREQTDFECSLFMSSLRKRPCLRVYHMCPWFYPHCVSLLGVWKQFTEVLLFILAVGVWCPCILCMEICRAMVCCCLCTG